MSKVKLSNTFSVIVWCVMNELTFLVIQKSLKYVCQD